MTFDLSPFVPYAIVVLVAVVAIAIVKTALQGRAPKALVERKALMT